MADAHATRRRGLLADLKRRRLVRVILLYAVVGWVVIEVASVVLPALQLPPWAVTFVTMVVALGFPIALALAWAGDPAAHATPHLAPASDTAAVAPRAAQSAEPAGRHSIAVLPFVNMSGDPENEYFSDGIAEEILNLLTKLPQLKVSSRTSSFVFKGKEASIPTVARELHVGSVLEGSVRRAGNHVRISAQLIDTASDSHLWSETYDRELKDVFAIQDDIARSIAEALRVTLGPRERRALQTSATANPQAYDYYLRGRRYFYAMRRRDFLHAIRMYEHAIEADPTYAMAYAGLADAYSFLYRYTDANPDNAGRADRASARAIELDPDCAEAQAARGTALFMSGQHAEAEKYFETAILLNPHLWEPYFFYGRACMAAGKTEKAAHLFQQASDLNPADYQSPSFLAQAYEALGRHEAAAKAVARSMEIVEHHLLMDPDDSRALSLGAANLAEQGERERALEWTARVLELDGDAAAVQYNAACTYAVLGETDRALDLLERAVAQGWGDRGWVEHDGDLAGLHGHPRFNALLQHMG
jgi:adenylate cyclase